MNDTLNDRDGSASRIEEAIRELEQIADLPGLLDPAFGWMFPDKQRNYRTFWQKAKEVSDLFRTSRLSQEDRERLWSKQSRLCDKVKELQSREREHRHYLSKQHRDEIISILHDARAVARGAEELKHLTEARGHSEESLRLMKTNYLSKDDRDECWKLWAEVKDLISARRREIYESNYDAFQSDINRIADLATYGDPREALQAIQELQREIKGAELTRDQRHWLRESLQKYWDAAMARIEEHRREGARKHEEWRGRMEDKLAHLEALVEKNEGVISRLNDHIDELESKIADAWNEDWAERARGWVQEMYDKIADIEHTNEELEEKITEIRSKLED